MKALRAYTSRLTPSRVSPQLAPVRPGTAGVEGLEVPHGGRLAAGGAEQGQGVVSRPAVQAAGHGAAVPGGVAVLVRQDAGPVPLLGVDAVKHGEEEGAPGGLPRFVGGLEDVQAVLKLQGLLPEAAEGGGHAADQQEDQLL